MSWDKFLKEISKEVESQLLDQSLDKTGKKFIYFNFILLVAEKESLMEKYSEKLNLK
jgi:hypothetical protein